MTLTAKPIAKSVATPDSKRKIENHEVITRRYNFGVRNNVTGKSGIICVHAESFVMAQAIINNKFSEGYTTKYYEYLGELIQHDKKGFYRINLKPNVI